ncbi:MAG: SDR family oxidoreductase [Syntrophobacterales bacterium]|nr:SDR family oxidoreductase [Syntrophobacterales bacterium]
MNILVTGGTGYLGSRLVPFLAGHGYDVAVWDSDSERSPSVQDFFDAGKLTAQAVLKAKHYEAVIHLVGTYSKEADVSRNLNYLLTMDVYEACRRNGVGLFVFISTCGVLNREDHSEYTRQKRLAEAALLEASDHSPVQLVILRLAPVYGLAPHMKYDSIVNGFIRDAATQGRLDIWGREERRPVVDICTVLKEILKVIQSPPSGKIVPCNPAQ